MYARLYFVLLSPMLYTKTIVVSNGARLLLACLPSLQVNDRSFHVIYMRGESRFLSSHFYHPPYLETSMERQRELGRSFTDSTVNLSMQRSVASPKIIFDSINTHPLLSATSRRQLYTSLYS